MNLKKLIGRQRISDSQKEVITWFYMPKKIAWRLLVTFGSAQEMIDNAEYLQSGRRVDKVTIGGNFNGWIEKEFRSTEYGLEFWAYVFKNEDGVADGRVQINTESRYYGTYQDETEEFKEYLDKGLYPVRIDWYDGKTYTYDKNYILEEIKGW